MKLALSILITTALMYGVSAGIQGAGSPLGPGRKYSTIERLQPERLRAVHLDRMRYAAARHEVTLKTGYTDYRAILHVHAEDSSHTGGTRAELLQAALKAGVNIVMLTDHVRSGRDFINDSWKGLHQGVLFIPGAESEGFLVYPRASTASKTWKTRDEYIKLIKQDGGNIFLSHAEERLDWPQDELDGMEIYNHHTDVKDEGEFNIWLRGALTNADRLRLLQTALIDYPEEVFSAQQDYLSAIIGKWDRDSQKHRLTGVAANDCHHNQVFTVTVHDENSVDVGYITSAPTKTTVTANQIEGVRRLVSGLKPGELIARLDFDPYERSFKYVATHVLSADLSEAAIREALAMGHAYVAHDWICDSSGFAFVAMKGSRKLAEMGDELKYEGGLSLVCALPVEADLKLFRNGVPILTKNGNRLEYKVTDSGIYRLEAWLTLDGESRPWVYSNPVYVRGN